MKLWREARALRTPVAAWASIVENPEKRAAYTSKRGLGGFVRADLGRGQRDHRRRQRLHGQDLRPRSRHRLLADPRDVDGELRRRLALSVAARRRLHVVLRLVLRPAAGHRRRPGASRPTCRNSADWYNAGFLILWGSNVPQTRTPDAHFYTEVRYKGAKSVVICPDYSEASKFADLWISVKQGTDAALGMAMGHVILREFHLDRQAKYFEDYVRQYTDMPMLVRLVKPGRRARARAAPARLRFRRRARRERTIRNGRPSPSTSRRRRVVVPRGSVGFRWGEQGQVEPGREGLRRRRYQPAADARRGQGRRSPTWRFPISAIASTITSPAPIIRACWSATCR